MSKSSHDKMLQKGVFTGKLEQDENGNYSSKRFIGIIAGLTLCVTMIINSYSQNNIKPSDTLVDAVAMLSFGCLGLASADKIFAKKFGNDKPKES